MVGAGVGGIGSEGAAFMETVAPRWAATLAFGVKDGKPPDFAAEVKMQVCDAGSGKRRARTPC